MRIKPVKTSATPPAHLVNFDHRLGVIQYRPPGSLKPYANNPRKHPEKQIVKLMASISQFGFYLPAVIDDEGTIIIGDARVAATRRLGIPEVPVLIEDKLTSSQRRALRIADNKLAELGTWDLELLAIEINDIIDIGDVGLETFGFDTGEIDFLLDESTGELLADDPADAVPAIPKFPVTWLGDVWSLEKHRLLCGSSLNTENWTRLMAGEVAQMLFTDAPYNVRIQGNVSGLGKVKHKEFAQASGEMSSAKFTKFLTDAIGCAAAHLKDGAVLDTFMDWRSLGALIEAVGLNDLSLLNMCVWNKKNGGMGSLYRSKHELVLIAKKGKAPHTNNVQLGKYGRYRTNVWDYAGANSFSASRDQDLADQTMPIAHTQPFTFSGDGVEGACPAIRRPASGIHDLAFAEVIISQNRRPGEGQTDAADDHAAAAPCHLIGSEYRAFDATCCEMFERHSPGGFIECELPNRVLPAALRHGAFEICNGCGIGWHSQRRGRGEQRDARAGIQFEHKSSPASPGNMSTISDETNASRG